MVAVNLRTMGRQIKPMLWSKAGIMVINRTGSEYGKAIRDVERKQIMWRKNKAEHINGGEGLKEVFIWVSKEGRTWREWNITLRRHGKPLSWGKNGEHRGCMWNMLSLGWSGRLQYWEMMRGANACLWSLEAEAPFIFVSSLVNCFIGSSLYPEPATLPCLQVHTGLGYKILVSIQSSLWKGFQIIAVVAIVHPDLKDRKKCLQRASGFARAYLGGWPSNTSGMIRHLCTD